MPYSERQELGVDASDALQCRFVAEVGMDGGDGAVARGQQQGKRGYGAPTDHEFADDQDRARSLAPNIAERYERVRRCGACHGDPSAQPRMSDVAGLTAEQPARILQLDGRVRDAHQRLDVAPVEAVYPAWPQRELAILRDPIAQPAGGWPGGSERGPRRCPNRVRRFARSPDVAARAAAWPTRSGPRPPPAR